MVGELRPRKTPCASCPYRRDAPSGVWDASEYNKLLQYDGDTSDQVANGAYAVFMCHQQDGCMCAGWIAVHDASELLALRLASDRVDWPAALQYRTDVPLHTSGAAAREHGLRELHTPGDKARRTIDKIVRKNGGTGHAAGTD